MIFNDIIKKDGAIQNCEEWNFGGDYGSISDNPLLLLKFTNLINRGLDKTKSIINKTDGRWQDDDPNFTDVPEDTTDLTNGISEYLLDRSHSIIEGFEVLDISGNYYPLKPIDYRDIRDDFGTTQTEFQTPSGLPVYYELKGDIVKLFPAPSSTSVTCGFETNGLKIVYKRESDYFVSTDTDKEMGIPRMFHDLPCLFASEEYAKKNSSTTSVKLLEDEIIKRSQDLKDHLSSRNKDEQVTLSSESINSI